MLNTTLRTSQQRVLGTAILQWDTFSLDICHVLQFYREALAEPISHQQFFHHPSSSLIILVYFGIIWNLDIFLETFGYFCDILEICWRSIIRVSSVIISYIQQICTILTFQYLTKAFSCLQTIKVTFFILHHFSVVSPRCVSPFFLPVVSPQCVSPFLGRSPRASLSAFPLKKEQTDGNRWIHNETK